MQQQIKRQNIDINGRQNIYKVYNFALFNSILYFTDDDEIYNNPNLHSEEQDELEIPDGKDFFKKNEKTLNYYRLIFYYFNLLDI
jgi:hypothetical protein